VVDQEADLVDVAGEHHAHFGGRVNGGDDVPVAVGLNGIGERGDIFTEMLGVGLFKTGGGWGFQQAF
jgi:hypothetical protein